MFFGPKPPFELGTTASGLAGSSTAVSDTLVPANWEGQVWPHAHALANSTHWVAVTGGVLTGSNKPKWGHNTRLCIAVRNTHASAVAAPCLTRAFFTAGTDANPHYAMSRTADVASAVTDVALPADECLPSSGASPNDIFWCVYSGLATVLIVGGAVGATATVAQKDFVKSTTGGYVLTSTTTLQGAVGRACHAQDNQSGTPALPVVIHVGRWP